MKAYKRLLSGVLTVVLLLSGCGATVTAGLFKSKIGFIGETGKNNMKLYDEFKDWERQVSAPVAVVDEGIYLKRKGEVQQLSCGKNDLVWESEIAAIYNGRIYYVAPSSTVITTTVNSGYQIGNTKGYTHTSDYSVVSETYPEREDRKLLFSASLINLPGLKKYDYRASDSLNQIPNTCMEIPDIRYLGFFWIDRKLALADYDHVFEYNMMTDEVRAVRMDEYHLYENDVWAEVSDSGETLSLGNYKTDRRWSFGLDELNNEYAKQLYEIYQEELSAELEKEKAVNEAVVATNYLWSPTTQLQFDKVIVVNSKIYFSVAYTSTDKANSLLLFEFDPWNETLSYADCIPLNKYIHNSALIPVIQPSTKLDYVN